MISSFVIVFREMLEAGLIVGIVLAATMGIKNRARYLAGGVAAGVAGACAVAASVNWLAAALAGNGQDVFNAGILCFAVVMLGWHTVWMAKHGRQMSRELTQLGRAVTAGESSLMAMAMVVAIAILREGSEVVLFLFGIATAAKLSAMAVFLGSAFGVAAGAAVSWLLYRGLLAIPLHRLFGVTGWLIALLAAGMAGRAAALLANDDLIPALGYQLWDTSWLVAGDSLAGRALGALVGYSDRPMGIQVLAYIMTLGTLITATRLISRPASPPLKSEPTHVA